MTRNRMGRIAIFLAVALMLSSCHGWSFQYHGPNVTVRVGGG